MQFRRNNKHESKEKPCSRSDGFIPLTSLSEGSKAVMMHTTGNSNVVRRLSEMGLTPGCKVQLLRKCSFHGPLEIEVRGAALAIGYTLAAGILVQEMKANSSAI